MRKNLLERTFKDGAKNAAQGMEELFDSQRALSYFERAITGELFELGTSPLFRYDMAPGDSLRSALSGFLEDFQANRKLFSNISFPTGSKVYVQCSKRTAVFVQMSEKLSKEQEEQILDLRKQMNPKSKNFTLVYSKQNQRFGLIHSRIEESGKVYIPLNRTDRSKSGGLDA